MADDATKNVGGRLPSVDLHPVDMTPEKVIPSSPSYRASNLEQPTPTYLIHTIESAYRCSSRLQQPSLLRKGTNLPKKILSSRKIYQITQIN